ncbi:hypothetical protein P7C73_g5554, partial [Tremellales sp. Uapishka_1]
MSASSQREASNYDGGSPISKDLIPAIVFAAALALTLPLLAWRILSRKHRSKILTNAVLYFLTRMASLILRAYMSRKTYGDGVLVAELVLMSISALFLINSLIDLWQKHTEETNDVRSVDNNGRRQHSPNKNGNMQNPYTNPDVDNQHGYQSHQLSQSNNYPMQHHNNIDGLANISEHPQTTGHGGVHRQNSDEGTLVHKEHNVKWAKYVANFLRVVLLAALATAIASGAIFGMNFTSGQKSKVVADLIKASYILGLATTVVGLFLVWMNYFMHKRSLKKTLFMSMYSAPLLVSSVYRVVRYRATTRQLVAFWVAMILMEFIAYSMLLAISIPAWFAEHYRNRHNKHHSDSEKHSPRAGRDVHG